MKTTWAGRGVSSCKQACLLAIDAAYLLTYLLTYISKQACLLAIDEAEHRPCIQGRVQCLQCRQVRQQQRVRIAKRARVRAEVGSKYCERRRTPQHVRPLAPLQRSTRPRCRRSHAHTACHQRHADVTEASGSPSTVGTRVQPLDSTGRSQLLSGRSAGALGSASRCRASCMCSVQAWRHRPRRGVDSTCSRARLIPQAAACLWQMATPLRLASPPPSTCAGGDIARISAPLRSHRVRW